MKSIEKPRPPKKEKENDSSNKGIDKMFLSFENSNQVGNIFLPCKTCI